MSLFATPFVADAWILVALLCLALAVIGIFWLARIFRYVLYRILPQEEDSPDLRWQAQLRQEQLAARGKQAASEPLQGCFALERAFLELQFGTIAVFCVKGVLYRIDQFRNLTRQLWDWKIDTASPPQREAYEGILQDFAAGRLSASGRLEVMAALVNNLGCCLALGGRFGHAAILFGQAIASIEMAADCDTRTGKELRALISANLRSARVHHWSSKPAPLDDGQWQDDRQSGLNLVQRSLEAYVAGQDQEADEHLEEAIAALERELGAGEKWFLAAALHDLAMRRRYRGGDPFAAVDLLERAQALAKPCCADDHWLRNRIARSLISVKETSE